jgi:hypothetical protein
MAKSTEDFQRELYQLMAQLGELELMINAFKRELSSKHSQKNTVIQKVETLQKSFKAHLDNQPAPSPAPIVAQPTVQPSPEVSNAPADQNG